MNKKKEVSAGILVYRIGKQGPEVLLGKCGGPYWQKKSVGSWNIPKGHLQDGESTFAGAIREFQQETSLPLDIGDVTQQNYLGMTTTKTGKDVHIYALEKDYAPSDPNQQPIYNIEILSNLCDVEWPPHSGRMIKIPELSQAYYFKLDVAKRMIFPYQKVFIDNLENFLNKTQNNQPESDQVETQDGECGCVGGDAGGTASITTSDIGALYTPVLGITPIIGSGSPKKGFAKPFKHFIVNKIKTIKHKKKKHKK